MRANRPYPYKETTVKQAHPRILKQGPESIGCSLHVFFFTSSALLYSLESIKARTRKAKMSRIVFMFSSHNVLISRGLRPSAGFAGVRPAWA
jgi:hypothetical protein